MSQFNQYAEELHRILSGERMPEKLIGEVKEKVPSPRYFVKGDVSGIQSFIFSVPSRNASKELKARSEYVRRFVKKWLENIMVSFNKNHLISEGGGNFYLFVHATDIEQLEKIRKEIIMGSPEGLFLAIEWVRADALEDFSQLKEELDRKLALRKFRKYSDMPGFFSPLEAKQPVSIHKQQEHPERIGLPVWNQAMVREYEFIKNRLQKAENNGISSKENEKPVEGSIITFGHLAEFAYFRTGTEKLGILKMDIDNLGLFFRNLPVDETVRASQCLNYFFNEHVLEMLQEEMYHDVNNETIKSLPGAFFLYSSNLYLVFSGGDDCFIVGAWDAVFEFAYLIREKLREFTMEDQLPDDLSRITLSAALQIYSPHYPVYRFSLETEERLHEAKYFEPDKKDKISLLGEVLTWEEFEQVIRIKNSLYKLIVERGESRAILERIKDTGKIYARDEQSFITGVSSIPRTWRLNYSFSRNVKNKENIGFIEEKILPEYESNLLRAYYEKKRSSAMIFPLAARYTELLTRNFLKNNGNE